MIFLEYHIYDAVYVNTNKITRQSTGLTINIIIKGSGQRIVWCAWNISYEVVYVIDRGNFNFNEECLSLQIYFL